MDTVERETRIQTACLLIISAVAIGAALEHAFAQALNGRRLRVGDVVVLEDGRLHRCEMDGWTRVGMWWSAKSGRARAERMQ